MYNIAVSSRKGTNCTKKRAPSNQKQEDELEERVIAKDLQNKKREIFPLLPQKRIIAFKFQSFEVLRKSEVMTVLSFTGTKGRG